MQNITVISDFDGTIVIYDVFEQILDSYSKEDWRIYDYLADEGKLKLEEAIMRQFSLISHLKEEEILEFSKKFLIERDYATDFIKFCNDNSIKLVIASAGLSTYIKYFFKRKNLNATIFCLEVQSLNGKLTGKLPFFEGEFKNFKEAIVKRYKSEANYVVYVGDGFNDFWSAIQSDLIFSVEGSVLSEKLNKAKIKHEEFFSFKYVIEKIKKLL